MHISLALWLDVVFLSVLSTSIASSEASCDAVHERRVDAKDRGQTVSIDCSTRGINYDIEIMSVISGANCDPAMTDNRTAALRKTCDGKVICMSYNDEHYLDDDVFANCAKDFRFQYRCVPTAESNVNVFVGTDRDICIKCSHRRREHRESESCDLLPLTDNAKITGYTRLVQDGLPSATCPIHRGRDNPLHRVIAEMVESTETIFEQLARHDEAQMIAHPPKWTDLTQRQRDEFSMFGAIPVDEWWLSNVQNEGHLRLEWTEREMDRRVQLIQQRNWTAPFTYDLVSTQALHRLLTSQKYRQWITGAHAVVVGSQIPWIETIALAAGAAHVTTSEYASINMTHPRMSYVHPKELNAAGRLGQYDVAFTYSSVEHSGLGRYGDPLNPIGDVQAMAQLSCLLKPGGLLFFGAPVSQDALQFNAHRIYGPQRLRLMFMQFRVIDAAPEQRLLIGQGDPNWRLQPWFVLQNKRGCAQFQE